MLAFLSSLFGGATGGSADDDVSMSTATHLFLSGHTIPKVSALLGASQETLIPTQRSIESEIRDYITKLERLITKLRKRVAELEEHIEQLEDEIARLQDALEGN